MLHILDPSARPVVEAFLARPVLIAFDFDGTLAPIVDVPAHASMRPRTRELLGALAQVRPVAIISGRAQRDVLDRVRGLGVIEAIGNHGLEPWRRAPLSLVKIEAWKVALRGELGAIPGVTIEDKVFSLAIHYRRAPDRELAAAQILASARRLPDAAIVGGKCVYNILPAGVPQKGSALLHARSRRMCTAAIYVGDDETDEDVFALEDPDVLKIRVEPSVDSQATFFLRDQEEIDVLLELAASRAMS